MKFAYKPILFLFLLLLADQVLKIYIKLSMTLGQSIHIFDWFEILFVENPGMAFGMELGSKIFLTLFRVVVAAIMCYYWIKLIKDHYKLSYILVVSLIFAGALGNIIDSMFYGLLFSESTFISNASFMPEAGGYAPFLMGKVVDMFYFPLFTFPEWIPYLGGTIFFSPVFNLADAYITVGIVLLLLFYRKDFNITLEQYTQKKKKQID